MAAQYASIACELNRYEEIRCRRLRDQTSWRGQSRRCGSRSSSFRNGRRSRKRFFGIWAGSSISITAGDVPRDQFTPPARMLGHLRRRTSPPPATRCAGAAPDRASPRHRRPPARTCSVAASDQRATTAINGVFHHADGRGRGHVESAAQGFRLICLPSAIRQQQLGVQEVTTHNCRRHRTGRRGSPARSWTQSIPQPEDEMDLDQRTIIICGAPSRRSARTGRHRSARTAICGIFGDRPIPLETCDRTGWPEIAGDIADPDTARSSPDRVGAASEGSTRTSISSAGIFFTKPFIIALRITAISLSTSLDRFLHLTQLVVRQSAGAETSGSIITIPSGGRPPRRQCVCAFVTSSRVERRRSSR